jgi:PKD repeat protein
MPWLYYCSGGLVADTVSSSQIPYFLTANHCVSTDSTANTIEFYWQYWTSSCHGACYDPVGAVPRTVGADVLSTNESGDYTLMELLQTPPSGSYFMGWTSSPVAFTNGAELFRISHPQGAPQAYSKHQVDTSAPTCSGWPRGSWIYSRDQIGATEGGSSGSPVYNLSGQIVGQLTGSCGYNINDPCDSVNNATVDGAFAHYFSEVEEWLDPSGNQPPTADFTYSTSGLTVDFTDQSTDSDGTVVAWSWDFGDGNTSTQQNPTHTYASDGTYTVTLTVTDDDGATDSISKDVTVTSGSPISLTANHYKSRGVHYVDLNWSGATGTNVNIYRNGQLIATTANDGSYTDNLGRGVSGTFIYKVCDGSACSNEATVNI